MAMGKVKVPQALIDSGDWIGTDHFTLSRTREDRVTRIDESQARVVK
jgi:hypothetical protein